MSNWEQSCHLLPWVALWWLSIGENLEGRKVDRKVLWDWLCGQVDRGVNPELTFCSKLLNF